MSKKSLGWVERLAQTLSENELHKLEFETEDISLVLKSRQGSSAPSAAAPTVAVGADPDVEEEDVLIIRSRDVGIFRPDAKLTAGTSLRKGQKLGSIEAVSVQHDLVCTHSGQLVEIMSADGDPVEWGQPLFVISESEG